MSTLFDFEALKNVVDSTLAESLWCHATSTG